MGYRQVHPLDATEENTLLAGHAQADPTVFILAGVVVGQRGRRAMGRIVVQEDAGLDDHLKTVADTQDQFAGRLEVGQTAGQVMPHLHGKNLPGGYVVAETESAGNAENLKPIEHGRRLQEAIDMERLGRRAGRFKSEGRFQVAVGAWGSEDEDVGLGHSSGEPGALASAGVRG